MLDPGPSLLEAAPFVQRFRDQFVVVKLGGELFDRGPILERIVPQIAVLYHCGLRPVLVHGGGQQIDARCAEREITIEKRGGRRVTSKAVLEVVLEVVAGQLNRNFCQLLSDHGLPVRGFEDGVSSSVHCSRRAPRDVDGKEVDFGWVGDVDKVDVEHLVGGRTDRFVVPVLPSIGALADGHFVNVNADSVAARVAVALGAQKLVLLSRVPGVMESADAAGPISQISAELGQKLIASGQVAGGMKAKVEEAMSALSGGVAQVHVISGIEPSTLLREIFTEEGCGTLITA